VIMNAFFTLVKAAASLGRASTHEDIDDHSTAVRR
jgi:hypothetical protein